MDRVEELAESKDWFNKETVKLNPNGVKWILDKTGSHPPFVKLVQLIQIIAESMSATVSSQKVVNVYNDICFKFGSELEVLLKTPAFEIRKNFGERLAEGIEKVRKGEIVILPGFDGQYGIVKIWDDKKVTEKQTNLVSQLGIDF
jgi:PHP family Zn ribbon phosphoesterase